MLLVTAANGNQGRMLLPRLLARGVAVRACTRSAESAAALRARGVHDVIVGDIAEPALLARALDGVRRVYHVGPSAHPRERAMGFGIVDAARAAGVAHFVFSSVLHAITSDLVQHAIKRDIEEHLLSSGLEFTILQPANYMAPWRVRPAFDSGVFRLSWALERRQSMVDIGDIAAVADRVLHEGAAHFGATYELCAEGRFTAHEIAQVITQVSGRPVTAQRIGAGEYLAALFGDGDGGGGDDGGDGDRAAPAHRARVLEGITRRYSRHDFVGNPNVLRWLLGRAPTTFEAFVRAQYTLHRQAPPPAAA